MIGMFAKDDHQSVASKAAVIGPISDGSSTTALRSWID